MQQGAPSDAGSIADSDDSDFQTGASSASVSESSSDEEGQLLRSQDVQRLHLQAGDPNSVADTCRCGNCTAGYQIPYQLLNKLDQHHIMLQGRTDACRFQNTRRSWTMQIWRVRMRWASYHGRCSPLDHYSQLRLSAILPALRPAGLLQDGGSEADGPADTQHSTAPTGADAVDSQPAQAVPLSAATEADDHVPQQQQPQSQQHQQAQRLGTDDVGECHRCC